MFVKDSFSCPSGQFKDLSLENSLQSIALFDNFGSKPNVNMKGEWSNSIHQASNAHHKGFNPVILLTPALSSRLERSQSLLLQVCQPQIMSHYVTSKTNSYANLCHGWTLIHQWPIVSYSCCNLLEISNMFEQNSQKAPDTSANHPWRTNAAWLRIRAIMLYLGVKKLAQRNVACFQSVFKNP